MKTESGFIILLDVTTRESRLDLNIYFLKEGFLGFQLVPLGLHLVSVGPAGIAGRFWGYMEPNRVIVRAFDSHQGGLEPVPPETKARYQQLALSGEIAEFLEPYDHRFNQWTRWQKMTNYIDRRHFPPILHEEDVAWKDWMQQHHTYSFVDALEGTHSGNQLALLEEFQFAFASWKTFRENPIGIRRWCHLLQAIYKASDSDVAKTPDLFCRLVDILLVQFSCLLDEEFQPDAVFYGGYLSEDKVDPVSGAANLIQVMSNSGIEYVAEKGQELAAYINQRKSSS